MDGDGVMPEERREQVTRVAIDQGQRANQKLAGYDGRRQPSMGGTSRISRQVPGPTRPGGAIPPAYSLGLTFTYSLSDLRGHAVTPRSKYSAMGCNQLQTVPPASADCYECGALHNSNPCLSAMFSISYRRSQPRSQPFNGKPREACYNTRKPAFPVSPYQASGWITN